MNAPMFTHSYTKKNLAYASGNVLGSDIVLAVDGEASLLVTASATTKANLIVDGVAKSLNDDTALAADAWYAFTFPIPRNTPINFSFSTACTAQFHLVVTEHR